MSYFLIIVIYMAFIGLGLPDSLLGSAWPGMSKDLSAPISYAGIISMIIAIGTVVSSLQCDRLLRKIGAAKITIISIIIMVAALFGFSISNSYFLLFLWAVPYGLGAGSIDAALNNYVAINYSSKHMNWLHCMWGVGASLGPYIISYALRTNGGWKFGYRYVGVLQIIIVIFVFLSLPAWKKNESVDKSDESMENLTFIDILKIKGVKELMIVMFCYCALEQTIGLWAGSYFNIYLGFDVDIAARLAAFSFIGVTIGRAVSGFVSIKLNDEKMIFLGCIIIFIGIILMIFKISIIGFCVTGLGCAPIYPGIIHQTPSLFGKNRSQAIIGILMASAYTGIFIMPPIFGFIAKNISMSILPYYLLITGAVMFSFYYKIIKIK